MPFYEVIFETGDHSIVQADTDEEVQTAMAEQHTRAKSGLPGGPAGNRAERVTRVLKYDMHPGDDSLVNMVDPKGATARFKEVLDDADVTDQGQVALSALSEALVPPVVLDTPVHESNYAYKESAELDPTTWGGEAL